MDFKTTATVALMAAAMCANAQKPMKAPVGGKQISDQLIGIFFEDISYAADGGLNAEMIQNGSFEFNPSERDGWGPSTAWKTVRPGHSLGHLEAKQQHPIHKNNPNYMRLNIERTREFNDYKGWRGFGMQNDGFNGLHLKEGAKYDFSMFARNISGDAKEVRIALVQPQGWGKNPKLVGEAMLKVDAKNWTKYSATIVADTTVNNGALQILALTNGQMDVDMISLMPQDTYKGHGLRKDLAEALEGLNPKFMRFPGGCVVHGGGDGFWNTYRWKETVGPKETRRQQKNTWGYHQSMALGYYEYFQLCEDMNMQPVPILPCGVNCQGTNGGWEMWPTQAQDACDMKDMDMWTQEALDLIEWANGPADSKWGAVRAAAGHPEPFNLKYLGIGNEEKISPEFIERFKYMYERITKAHPEIVIVGTAGPGSHPGNPDYEAGWKLAEELGMPIIDEHYYDPREKFLNSRQYDSYPRNRKTKVYLGEYSVQEKQHGNQFGDALAEALYLMHVERNGDIVEMTSYAPLFAYKNNTNWNPDLIYFDDEKPFYTCSYYVQQMFGQSSGTHYYGDCVKFQKEDDKFLGQSVVLDTKSRTLYVKYANYTDETQKADIDLSRFGAFKNVKKTFLTGNLDDENNYDKHPVAPQTTTLKKFAKKQTVEVAPRSFTLISIKL